MYKSMSKKVIALAIIGSMATSTIAGASEINKDESVYVNLSSDGKVEKTTVTNWIHTDSGNLDIEDETSLKNIENIKGDDKPIKDGDKLKWKVNGSDLYYSGNTDKEIPLDVKINYFINDEKVKENEIAGKSGKIRIELEFKNKSSKNVNINGKTRKIYTPLTTATIVKLPIDKFKDLKVNSGTIISEGNNNIVAFAAFPGIKESLNLNDKDLEINLEDKLVIEGYVENFELGPIMITATTQLPDLSKLKAADSIDEIKDSLNKLNDASDELLKGTNALSEGLLKAKKELDKGKGQLNNNNLKEALGIINSDKQVSKANKLIDDAYFAKNINTAKTKEVLSLFTEDNVNKVNTLIKDGEGILQNQKLLEASINTFRGLSKDDNFNKLLNDITKLKEGYENINPETLKKLNNMTNIISGQNLKRGQNLINSARKAKNSIEPMEKVLDGAINSTPGGSLDKKANNFLGYINSKIKNTQKMLSNENLKNMNAMASDMKVYGSSYLIMKSMVIGEMNQNKIPLAEAKAKVNKYIDGVYGSQGAQLKNVINSLTEKDFTKDQIQLDAKKINGYGENMKGIMASIKDLKELDPILNSTSSVLSNESSRANIAKFYSSYKDNNNQKIIKGIGDSILSLNENDIKAIEGLKNNLNLLSEDIKLNKNNIESINKMINGIKENKNLIESINKFYNDLDSSQKTIDSIKAVLSSGNGELNIKEVKYLGNKLLSMQQDLKDSEDILRITRSSLEKGNVQRARELIKSLPQLEDGVNQLADGSQKLNNGMKEFNEKGIKTLSNKGEEATEKVEDVIEVKDELVKLSNEYDTFTGKNNKMDGSVKFIMKTNEIKAPETKEVKENNQEEETGFIAWIKKIIKNIF